MKDFDVSLDVHSDALTLSDLSSILRHPPDRGSHSRGDRRHANLGVFDETIWSLYSRAPTTAPLEEHLESIKSQFSPDRLRSLSVVEIGKIKSVFIDIALFFEADSFSAHVILSREVLRAIDDYGANVRVICYPCSEKIDE
jgi:hypothetical protein